MKKTALLAVTFAIILAGAYFLALPVIGRAEVRPIDPSLTGDAKRGEYVAISAGCYACHTDEKAKGKPFAGGRAFKTPFGTIYSPNITPDKETGIGAWTVADFNRALVVGVSPEGSHYYPAFPYTSYAHMKAQDVVDLKAYFDSLTPVQNANRSPDMPWPFSDRNFVGVWKFLNNPRVSRSSITADSGEISRGAYLVEVLGHCAECHTQRDLMGGYSGASLAGNTRGPDGGKVPGIRDVAVKWSNDDVELYLTDGMTPEGDFVGGEMAHVVNHSTSKLKQEDLAAIFKYLRAIAPPKRSE